MPSNEEPRRAAVYGTPTRARQPRWLMPAAVAFCATGVLVGVLLAAGVFANGGSGGDTSARNGVGTLTTAGATEGTATAQASPAPSVSTSPRTTPRKPPGPAPATSPTQAGLPADVRLLKSASWALCLDIPAGTDPEGADVQLADCAGTGSQQWRTVDVAPKVITLVNVASGLCLDVDGRSRSDKADVQQSSCNKGTNQQWAVVDLGGEKAMLIAVHSGKCLEVPGPTAKPGAQVRQSSCDGGPRQQWTSR